jgi:hypothetical protein
MEKLFDLENVNRFWTGSMEMAARCNDVARTLFETQVAATQKATVEAVNRSFDLAREAVRMADETSKAFAEQARKVYAAMPNAAA